MSEQTTKVGRRMDKETLDTYRTLVSIAAEGPSEYVAVVAEMQDFHAASGKLTSEEVLRTQRWAIDTAQYITEKMERDNVAPHYFIGALMEALYDIGYGQMALALEKAVLSTFAEDFA